MTYNEILSAAQSLSETERQSLLQAAISARRQSRKALVCLPCWKNRAAVLIVEATATTVSARTTERNASSARIAAGLSPNIPARGSRSSTRKGL